MLAISALSGKFAEPITICPPAAAEPEAPDPDAAAEVAELVELDSGLEELPHADRVSTTARPAATKAPLRVSVDRRDTGTPWWSGTAELADRKSSGIRGVGGGIATISSGGPTRGPARRRRATSEMVLVAVHPPPPIADCVLSTTRSAVVAET